MNNKKGLHRVFIILSFVTFISFVLLVNTVYIEEPLLKFAISFCVASAVYLTFWVGIWIVAGFNADKETFSNKGLIVNLILLIALFGFTSIFFYVKYNVAINKYNKIETEYSKYKSRIEGNFTGWTLEEIKDLFNSKP